MFKRMLLWLGFCIFVINGALASGSIGNGVVRTQARTVPYFDAVQVSGAFAVNISAGQHSPSLSVQANTQLFSHIKTKVVNNKLIVTLSHGAINFDHDPIINIHLYQLKQLSLSGANHVVVKNLHNDYFKCFAQGANHVELAGIVKHFTLHLFGANHFQSTSLMAQRVNLKVSGVSEAFIDAQEFLDANISGVSSVRYLGRPEVRQVLSGISSLVSIAQTP